MIAASIGAAGLGIWIYLIFARGGFWRMRVDEPPRDTHAVPPLTVAIIVPARNEAPIVGLAVTSLLRQHYRGRIRLFLIDDHSSDNTAAIAARAAEEAGCSDRLMIVRAGTLPKGWTGKLWAVSEGLQAAASFASDYYLLTDADVVHEPENLRDLVARAETGGFDLVSLMVKLRYESFAERTLAPAFVFFFFMLYPPAWIARSDRRTAAAAGGCILIRSAALARIGGISVIRNQLIDDCALARAVKPGGRIWLGLTSKASSLRSYQSWSEVGRMISRTAFTQLRHSGLLLAAVIFGIGITYLVPPVLLGFGVWAGALGVATWLLMAIAYRPILRFYGLSWAWALLLPFIAAFYLGATIHSAVEYRQGRGIRWKGRIQDPSDQ